MENNTLNIELKTTSRWQQVTEALTQPIHSKTQIHSSKHHCVLVLRCLELISLMKLSEIRQ